MSYYNVYPLQVMSSEFHLSVAEFESILDDAAAILTREAQTSRFTNAKDFENRVRVVLKECLEPFPGYTVDLSPPAQEFPDIAIQEFGVEVKFTTSDNWRCIGNSIQETQRIEAVKHIYVMYGKMGGTPEVRWRDYESSVVHVRTSHVPRFEVEVVPDGTGRQSLFDAMGISYDKFRHLPIEEKMRYIRKYAKKIHPDGRLWWLGENHTIPAQARLYIHLSTAEKTRCRAEAALISPKIVSSGRSRNKYDDVVLYLLTYRGILCHQARDLFSAGSVANADSSDRGGLYIMKAIQLIESEMRTAAEELDDSVFVEYWGESVPPKKRIARWLEKADGYAKDWKPSEVLFKKSKT